jgi:hypothetical protein
MVALIVVLVLIASFLPQIVTVAGFILVIVALWFLGSFLVKRFGKKSATGNYCTNCPHPNHGRQVCGSCNCRSS